MVRKFPYAEEVNFVGACARAVLLASKADSRKLLRQITPILESWNEQHWGDLTVLNNIDLALKLFTEQYDPFVRLMRTEGLPTIVLAVLVHEIETHPAIYAGSVLRALSLCLVATARELEGNREDARMRLDVAVELSKLLKRFRSGLRQGTAAGAAATKANSQSKRSQCVAIDNELLRNPVKRKWSLNDRTDFVHREMVEKARPDRKPPAWTTVKDYLKNNKKVR